MQNSEASLKRINALLKLMQKISIYFTKIDILRIFCKYKAAYTITIAAK